MANVGRPTKLTPQIQDDLCRVVAMGNYLETACAFVGVSTATVRDWMRRGARAKRGIYVEFLAAIKRAMAQGEVRDVATIVQASRENWQAAAWRLERKHWKRWGRKERVQQEISGRDGKEIEIKQTVFDHSTAIASIASRSAGHSAEPSPNESSGDGQTLG